MNRAALALALVGSQLASSHCARSATSLATGVPAAPMEVDAQAQVSVTRLTVPPCVLLDVRGGAREPLQRCPGLAGYELQLERDASPPGVSVLGPRGERWVLYLERVTSASHNGIGRSAVWYVEGVRVVVALPLVSAARRDGEVRWAIAKVTPERACFTDVQSAAEDSAEALTPVLARAHRRPCLPP